MKYLTTNVGQGPKRALKHLQIKDDSENILKVMNRRDKLEDAIIK